MSIPVTCPACLERYQLADEMAGKHVRCRKCQDTFQVPDLERDDFQGGTHRLDRPLFQEEEDPAPRRRDRGSRDRDERRPRSSESTSSGGSVVLLVLSGLGLVFLIVIAICGGIIWSISYSAGRAVDQAVSDIKSMQPPPPPPRMTITNVDQALQALRSTNVVHRRQGAEWFLRATPPLDPISREEVVRALDPLTRDPDISVSVPATIAKSRWEAKR